MRKLINWWKRLEVWEHFLVGMMLILYAPLAFKHAFCMREKLPPVPCGQDILHKCNNVAYSKQNKPQHVAVALVYLNHAVECIPMANVLGTYYYNQLQQMKDHLLEQQRRARLL